MITFGLPTMQHITDTIRAHMVRHQLKIGDAYQEFEGSKFKITFTVELNHQPKDSSNLVDVKLKYKTQLDAEHHTQVIANDEQMSLFKGPLTVDMETGEVTNDPGDEKDLEEEMAEIERMQREAHPEKYEPTDEGEPD